MTFASPTEDLGTGLAVGGSWFRTGGGGCTRKGAWMGVRRNVGVLARRRGRILVARSSELRDRAVLRTPARTFGVHEGAIHVPTTHRREFKVSMTTYRFNEKVLEIALRLFDDAAASAFFALLDPFQGRAHELTDAAILEMRATGADFEKLAAVCDELVRSTDGTGPMTDQGSYLTMVELQGVLHRVARLGPPG